MRQKQLDGIRAVAVLLVIASHHDLLGIGWIGVDIFFVLSGFLITRILLRSKVDVHYWKEFYIKRAGRIFPPLLILLILTCLFSRHIKLVGLLGYALFLGNYMNLTHYSTGLLVMLWSLAIEEHFYLVWPLAIRYLSKRRCIQTLIAVLLAEPLLRLVATRWVGSYESIYYLTWFRLDSIAAGSLLALLSEYPEAFLSIVRSSVSLFGASVGLYSLLWYRLGSAFTKEANSILFNSIGYSLSTTMSFFLIAYLVGIPESLTSRALSSRVLVLVGKISYGMYLFHQIVLAITRRLFHVVAGVEGIAGTRKLFCLDLLLVIGLSWLSFQFIELPIIQYSRRKTDALEKAGHFSASRYSQDDERLAVPHQAFRL